jgi:hypothetical protein
VCRPAGLLIEEIEAKVGSVGRSVSWVVLVRLRAKMTARYVWDVWANLQVKGDCKVLFGSVGDFVDTDFIRDIGHFIFCISSCPLHFRCARFVGIWCFVDRLRQRSFQDLCKVSVKMPSSSINQACLHNTVSIGMIVDRAASARTPNQDKL